MRLYPPFLLSGILGSESILDYQALLSIHDLMCVCVYVCMCVCYGMVWFVIKIWITCVEVREEYGVERGICV